MKIIHLRHLRNRCVYCINAWQILTQFNETSFKSYFDLLVAPAIWTTCRDANRYFITTWKHTRFAVITQCVYVTFYIKHHVSLLLIITAPWMRLVQSTWIMPTTNVSDRRRAGNIVTMQRRSENVVVASSQKKIQINWITWKVSRHNIVIIHDCERMLNHHPRFLEIHCRRGGRSRGRKSHLTRSLVASEGWSLVRDHTNRKHCPSHKTWSYKMDGRWWGWSLDTGSTEYFLVEWDPSLLLI